MVTGESIAEGNVLSVNQITAKELKASLDRGAQDDVLLDVREPWEFHTCHLQNSTHMPMGKVWHAFRELDPRRRIVVICHHGVRSERVCVYLSQHGYQRVVNLQGGLNAWSRDVDPDMPTY